MDNQPYISHYSTNKHISDVHESKKHIGEYDIDKLFELSHRKYDKKKIKSLIRQTPITPIQTITPHNTPISIFNNTLFWHNISLLYWPDLDEGLVNIEHLSRNREATLYVKLHISLKMDILRDLIQDDILILIDNAYHNDFLAHIIAKGYNFYSQVIEEHSICMYLINNINNLYTYLQSYV